MDDLFPVLVDGYPVKVGANVIPSAHGPLYVSVVPEPGTICPTCHEKTPSKGALYMRKWRKRKQ